MPPRFNQHLKPLHENPRFQALVSTGSLHPYTAETLPRHAVAVDRVHRQIVLAIRGKAVLVDMRLTLG